MTVIVSFSEFALCRCVIMTVWCILYTCVHWHITAPTGLMHALVIVECQYELTKMDILLHCFQKAYMSRMEFVLAQSTNVVSILCKGQGLLPRIEFSNSLVEFTPIVPFGCSECDVIVKNPCAFPVEIYSLEFDTVYLEEEKVSSSKVLK